MSQIPVEPSMSAQKPIIDRAVQIHLGCELRTLYGNPAEERLPQNLARLLDRVAQVIRELTSPR